MATARNPPGLLSIKMREMEEALSLLLLLNILFIIIHNSSTSIGIIMLIMRTPRACLTAHHVTAMTYMTIAKIASADKDREREREREIERERERREERRTRRSRGEAEMQAGRQGGRETERTREREK